ncbi:MAG: endo-1,4-beta-xylanase [Bacteroidota bacterium]
MKKIVFILSVLCAIATSLKAQDAYHSDLLSTLQAEYGLTGGNWMFYDNEAAILSNNIRYGGIHSQISATNQNFSTISRMEITSAKTNPWDAGWNIQNKIAVQQGDVVLFTFFLRARGNRGKVTFFVENATTYTKEVILTMPVDTNWQQYFIPIDMASSYGVGGLSVGYHLGFQAQTIEIAGFTSINYDNAYQRADLPEAINNQFYEGWEPTAPWRAETAVMIDSLRKADLTIETQDNSGLPLANGWVEVNMLRHEFAFGSAVTADKIAGNNNYNVIYENKILDLDGKGHGFNWVVFENDMKWPAWENNWFVSRAELVDAVGWLKSHDIKIRGHNLVWPGFDNLPGDIQNNQNDINYIKNRISNHLNDILTYPGIAENIEEWDVLNETVTNVSLENVFQGKNGYTTGREILTEIFQQAHQIDSTIGLYINDYITLSQQQEAGSLPYDQLKRNIQEMVDANSGISGVGFQGHIGGFPNGISSVKSTLDDFYNTYGMTAKITEFDMPTFVSDSLGAAYMKDFMKVIFGHPSMDGFLFWNFWDGSTWLHEGTNLFNRDWSMTLPGSTYVDLVFNEWWTEENLNTDVNGKGTVRGFKGLYEIVYTCDGIIQRDTLELLEDMTYTINCDQLTTGVQAIPLDRLKVYPNPVKDVLFIEAESSWLQVQLFDLSGRLVQQQEITPSSQQMDVSSLQKGMYLLEIKDKDHISRRKINIKE